MTCKNRGGDEGIRTLGPHVANVMLSQLSYIPTYMCAFARVGIIAHSSNESKKSSSVTPCSTSSNCHLNCPNKRCSENLSSQKPKTCAMETIVYNEPAAHGYLLVQLKLSRRAMKADVIGRIAKSAFCSPREYWRGNTHEH